MGSAHIITLSQTYDENFMKILAGVKKRYGVDIKLKLKLMTFNCDLELSLQGELSVMNIISLQQTSD